MSLATTNMRSSPSRPVAQKPEPATQSAQEVYKNIDELAGLVGQRHQLVMEMESLHERRLEIAKRLKVTSGDEARVMERIAAQLDTRITGAEVALSSIERAIESTSGAPAIARTEVGEKLLTQSFAYAGARPPNAPGEMAAIVGGGAFLAVAVVVATTIVYVRRLRRDVQRLSADLWGEVKKVSVGVDAIAVELERIGEGQRYVTKQLAEQKVPVERG